jgi:hypothetical protein
MVSMDSLSSQGGAAPMDRMMAYSSVDAFPFEGLFYVGPSSGIVTKHKGVANTLVQLNV